MVFVVLSPKSLSVNSLVLYFDVSISFSINIRNPSISLRARSASFFRKFVILILFSSKVLDTIVKVVKKRNVSINTLEIRNYWL